MSNSVMITDAPASSQNDSYADWGAILAGAALAAAIAFIMLAFGAALGLTVSASFEGTGLSLAGYLIAIGLWLVWVHVSSVMAGAYIAGRLRKRLYDATPEEVHVRDGAHGLTVWAVATVIAAWIGMSALGGALQVGSNLAKGTANVTAQALGSGSSSSETPKPVQNAVAYGLDVLFRPEVTNSERAAAPPNTAPSAGESNETAPSSAPPAVTPMTPASQPSSLANTQAPRDTPAGRQEIMRTLAYVGLDGEISDADKDYIVQVVSRNTGISPKEARNRVDAFVKLRNEAVSTAEAAAERARKFAIIFAFISVVSLLVAAAGGWWAASVGGQHRDEGTIIQSLIWR